MGHTSCQYCKIELGKPQFTTSLTSWMSMPSPKHIVAMSTLVFESFFENSMRILSLSSSGVAPWNISTFLLRKIEPNITSNFSHQEFSCTARYLKQLSGFKKMNCCQIWNTWLSYLKHLIEMFAKWTHKTQDLHQVENHKHSVTISVIYQANIESAICIRTV